MSSGATVTLAPTRHAGGLLLVLAAMWYAGASQGNNAAYLLLFFALSIAAVSIVHCWLNLHGIRIRADAIAPVFAGQDVAVPVELLNSSRKSRFAIECIAEGGRALVIGEIAAKKAVRAELRFLAPRRGEYTLDRIIFRSSFPLGFASARRVCTLDATYIVYPKPAGVPRLPKPVTLARQQQREGLQVEGDDFAGVRSYQPGESQHHVDWKAVARGQPMLVKQFAADGDGLLWLDWEQTGLTGTEERLSQLTLWIMEAERQHLRYGLRLPSKVVAPASGTAHYHRCLRELALFR